MYNDVTAMLRAFVHGEKPVFANDFDENAFLKCAYYQNILGIVAYMNRRYRFLSDSVSSALENTYYSVVSDSVVRQEAFSKLSARLSEEGIEHMPVKGIYIMEYYAVKELRSFGDIDILIRESDRAKTDELMRDLGYDIKTDWEPTYSYLKGNEFYEIHSNLFDVRLKNCPDMIEYFSKAWDYAEKRSELCFEPQHDFHFIYIICHIAKHLSTSGAGIRMFLDVAFFIEKFNGEMSWEYIKAEFKKLKLEKFLFAVLSAAEAWFGVTADCDFEKLSENELNELLAYTLGADIYGHNRDNTLVKLRTQKRPSKVLLFIKMIFPPKNQIENRYTFLKKIPLLLPLAWVVRFFKNIRLIPSWIKSVGNLKAADSDGIEKVDDFMKKIGL